MQRLKFPIAALFAIAVCSFGMVMAQDGPKQDNKDVKEQETRIPARSWKDQAQEAMSKGELTEGIYFYRRWLEADPRDSNSWYNLACAYALGGKSVKAMDALEWAVAAGWDDHAHMLRDTDLTSLREREDFKSMVKELQSKAAENQSGFSRHHVKFEATGNYAAYLPDDYDESVKKKWGPYPMVISLHGAGSTETGHAGAFKRIMGVDNAIFIAPRAPYAIPVGGGELGYVAWIPESRQLSWGSERSQRQWAAMIDACVADAISRYPVDTDNIHVIGHSMGGGASLVYTSLYPHRVKSVFSYAGYVMEKIQTPAVLEKVMEADVEVNICHCRGDAVVDFALSEKAAELWTEAGCSVNEIWLDDKTHGLAPSVQEAISSWARRHFGEGE